MRLFDFEYALELHSGLRDWVLTEGDPDNFQTGVPVVYTQSQDPEFVQRAVFIREPDDSVHMSKNDRPSIIGVGMNYMGVLYTRPI